MPRLTVIDRGSGPALVLVPGLQGRCEWMLPAVNALSRDFRVVTFTLAGDWGSRQRFNPDLGIVGVVLTMFDRRNRLTDQVADDVRDCLGKLVFEAVIPRNVRLSEAPSHGLPALVYDHSCAGSRAYIALARELIGRLPEKR